MAGDGSVMIGIIGGSGFSDPKSLDVEDAKDVEYDTPFGKPSSPLMTGTLCGVPVAVLARHGRQHTVMPGNVNYRANIWALRRHGCTHILVSTACGSLREEIRPGQLVLPDQFVDRTTKRHQTFFDGTCEEFTGVCHLPMAEPFCPKMRDIILKSAKELGILLHDKGTVVCVEGPRFSSRAESHMFRSWNCDIINMTTMPEVALAREAGLSYAAVALSTDYDCWRPSETSVTVDEVMGTFRTNVATVVRLLRDVVPRLAGQDWTEHIKQNKELVTANTMLPHQ